MLFATLPIRSEATDSNSNNEKTAVVQTSEALNVAGGAKAAVSEYYKDHGQLPINNEKAGIDEPYMIVGEYVVSTTITDGTISVTFGARATPYIYGHSIEFIPSFANGDFSWTCLSYTLQNKFLPRPCWRPQ